METGCCACGARGIGYKGIGYKGPRNESSVGIFIFHYTIGGHAFIPPTPDTSGYGGQAFIPPSPRALGATAGKHSSLNYRVFPINILPVIRSPFNSPSRCLPHEPLSVAKDKTAWNDSVLEVTGVLYIRDVFLNS